MLSRNPPHRPPIPGILAAAGAALCVTLGTPAAGAGPEGNPPQGRPGAAAAGPSGAAAGEEAPNMSLQITSPAFQEGKPIPARFTCSGEDISPELRWTAPPDGTRSFVLIMDDPDAPVGTWDHWLLFDLPAALRGLPEGMPARDRLADGGTHGKNSWGRNDYGGPCPPGGTHRYFFKLFALDRTLDLAPGASKAALLAAMEGHVLAEAQIMGTFSRS